MHLEQAFYSEKLHKLKPRKALNNTFLKIRLNLNRIGNLQDSPVRLIIGAIHPKAIGFVKPEKRYITS